MNSVSNCGLDKSTKSHLKVGDLVKFGNYFISNDQTKEPIEWRVLEVANNKALLITKEAIDCKPYNDEYTEITWEMSTLHQWLNNEFFNEAFTVEEQEEILFTTIANPNYSSLKSTIDSDLEDVVASFFNFFNEKTANEPQNRKPNINSSQTKIFLLSIDEVKIYFADNKDRECKPTSYSKLQDAFSSSDDQYLGNCFWWLRSPGLELDNAVIVDVNGYVDGVGIPVLDDEIAVRPALYISL